MMGLHTGPAKLSKRRGCLRVFWRGLAAVVLVLAILAGAGYFYERYASARDTALYPPLGQWVQVDQHKLHLYCTGSRSTGSRSTGSGTPTVILEAPANGSAIDWGFVQPELAKLTRVCSYDRAGFGWSELGPPPRTAQHAAEELHRLLGAAGERGPYILVGASYGGHVVRLYAHQYPVEAAGMVLVDPRPERLFSIPLIRQQDQSGLAFSRVIAFLGDFGLSRPFIAWAPEKMMPASAAPLYAARPGSYAIVFQAKLWHAAYAEAQALDTSDAQVAAIGSLGDLPLIVIRHGKPMFGSLPPADASAMEQQWQAFQEEIAKQSTASQMVVATGSGHSIQLDQPAVIVEAVQQLLK